jgi:hypothetical protein
MEIHSSSKQVMRIMDQLLTEIKSQYDNNLDESHAKAQLPKVHLHIDLESIKEADGVTSL